MFSQPPENKEQPTKPITNNRRRKRKRKISKKNKRVPKKDHTNRNNCFNITMSSWAETFTTAATWQLKHQVAYWKSKATMLAYENQILHDIIRKNYLKSGSNSPEDLQDDSSSESNEKYAQESQIDSDSDVEEQHDNFEVSEEFIQFLKENAKYKEDARREREQLKAKIKEEQQPMELCEQESSEFSEEKLKEMYGKDWRSIAALEMSFKCDFMSECDRAKPMYWPNIPFNFS